MSIYLTQHSIKDLISHRDKIFEEHNKAFQKYKIDILSNDILSSLSMWEIINQYDSDYEPNFHRNGEDGRSKDVLIERKCCTKLPTKKGTVSDGAWQFHAQETDKGNRFIFAVRRKDDLKIVRIYDITSDVVLNKIRLFLNQEKQKWVDKGMPNHDAIVLPEKLFKNVMPIKTQIIEGCQVIHL